MSEIELVNHLKKQIKPYQGIMEQGTFSNILIRYNAGLLKPITLINFFNKLGYFQENGVWVKKFSPERS